MKILKRGEMIARNDERGGGQGGGKRSRDNGLDGDRIVGGAWSQNKSAASFIKEGFPPGVAAPAADRKRVLAAASKGKEKSAASVDAITALGDKFAVVVVEGKQSQRERKLALKRSQATAPLAQERTGTVDRSPLHIASGEIVHNRNRAVGTGDEMTVRRGKEREVPRAPRPPSQLKRAILDHRLSTMQNIDTAMIPAGPATTPAAAEPGPADDPGTVDRDAIERVLGPGDAKASPLPFSASTPSPPITTSTLAPGTSSSPAPSTEARTSGGSRTQLEDTETGGHKPPASVSAAQKYREIRQMVPHNVTSQHAREYVRQVLSVELNAALFELLRELDRLQRKAKHLPVAGVDGPPPPSTDSNRPQQPRALPAKKARLRYVHGLSEVGRKLRAGAVMGLIVVPDIEVVPGPRGLDAAVDCVLREASRRSHNTSLETVFGLSRASLRVALNVPRRIKMVSLVAILNVDGGAELLWQRVVKLARAAREQFIDAVRQRLGSYAAFHALSHEEKVGLVADLVSLPPENAHKKATQQSKKKQ